MLTSEEIPSRKKPALRPDKKWFSDFKITEEQRKFFDENGWTVAERVMDEETCDELQSLIEPHADNEYSVKLNVHREYPDFLNVTRDPNLLESMRFIQRSDIDIVNDQYLFKKVGTPYAKQAWTPHQDNSYPRAPKGAYTVAHLILERSNQENGGLIFYRGSHVEDIIPFEHNPSYGNFDKEGVTHPGQTISIPEQYERVELDVPKGSVVFMHGNIIHESTPNMSSFRNRPQYSMAYMNRGVDFFEGKTSPRIRVKLY